MCKSFSRLSRFSSVVGKRPGVCRGSDFRNSPCSARLAAAGRGGNRFGVWGPSPRSHRPLQVRRAKRHNRAGLRSRLIGQIAPDDGRKRLRAVAAWAGLEVGGSGPPGARERPEHTRGLWWHPTSPRSSDPTAAGCPTALIPIKGFAPFNHDVKPGDCGPGDDPSPAGYRTGEGRRHITGRAFYVDRLEELAARRGGGSAS